MDLSRYRRIMGEIRDLPLREKNIRMAGIITDYVWKKKHISLTVVGGLSVEFYTQGGYATQDIDFVGHSHQEIMECLEDLSFQPYYNTDLNDVTAMTEKELEESDSSKMRIHPDLKVLVEVPDDKLKNADEELIHRYTTEDGYDVSFIGLDDIFCDRIRTRVHYGETMQYEWLKAMYELHKKQMDFDYIRSQLTPAESDFLDAFLSSLESGETPLGQQAALQFYLENCDEPFGRIHSVLDDSLFVFQFNVDDYIGFTFLPTMNIYYYDDEEMEFYPKEENIYVGLDFITVQQVFRDISEEKQVPFVKFVNKIAELCSKVE